jgi:predicted esterase
LIGFSQGACLASEFAATYPQRYGAVIAFTGGLPGPQGADLGHQGSLEGTPILLSSGDPDPHVPWTRVQETAAQFIKMRADVTLQRHPGRPHTITAEEISSAALILSLITNPAV